MTNLGTLNHLSLSTKVFVCGCQSYRDNDGIGVSIFFRGSKKDLLSKIFSYVLAIFSLDLMHFLINLL